MSVMKSASERKRAFCRQYFGARPRRGLPLSISLTRRARGIETIICDTSSIWDGSLHYSHAWSPPTDSDHILAAAHAALAGQSDGIFDALRATLPASGRRLNPIKIYDTRSYRASTRHDGARYRTYWIGEYEELINRLDATENEREQYLREAYRASANGQRAYLVAESVSLKPPTNTAPTGSLDFVGIVLFELTPLPRTRLAVSYLRRRCINIVYASTDDVTTVRTLAHQAGIIAQSTQPHDARLSRELPTDKRVYSNLTKSQQTRLYKQLSNGTTIITDRPLTEVWEQLSAFWR